MKLSLAQINPTIGDFEGNARLVGEFSERARAAGADAVVFPELALTGYPPKDLLIQEGFVAAAAGAAFKLGKGLSSGITVIFGTPLPPDGSNQPDSPSFLLGNSLLAYRDGLLVARYDKRLLPTYDVFDEARYFSPGDRPAIIDVAGVRVGLSICEDLWRGEDVGFAARYADQPDPVADLIAAGAEVIVNPSASPFVLGKGLRHRERLSSIAQRNSVIVASVNQVGGNDELVFDGHAAVFNAAGSLIAAAPGFEPHLLVIDVNKPSGIVPAHDPLLSTTDEELLFRALVLGVRDYCRKTGFSGAVLGLSGGIDSAVTAVIAAAALGPGNVLGIGLPSKHSSEGSVADARELAHRLGAPFSLVPIHEAVAAMERGLDPGTLGQPVSPAAADLAEQNVQSRVRGTLLMGISNRSGRILLTTGNKSELAVGYCTLYGDMNGGLAVLSDISKQWVYRLARWMNANPGALGLTLSTAEARSHGPIPEASISKPPSAELRPDQTDQDTLPPYDVLDRIIELYVEHRRHPAAIARLTGFDSAVIDRTIRMIDTSEFKRKQAAIGLKVTGVAFGSGRRIPIAQRYRPTSR